MSLILYIQIPLIAGAYPGGLWGPQPPGSLKGRQKKRKGKKRKKKERKEKKRKKGKKGTKRER